MSATTVKLVASRQLPQAGANNSGWKFGFIKSKAKAAQNDKWQVTNASEVIWAAVTYDTTGAYENRTISDNEITLTSSTTGNFSGLIIYR
jgi:hypothetical protein